MSAEDMESFSLLSTVALWQKVDAGDERARDALCARYLPRIQRWARGRLPAKARAVVDTDVIVQETLVRTLHRAKPFRPDHSGAFLGYVRRAVDNRIVDEVRKAGRAPRTDNEPEQVADRRKSPLEELLDDEKTKLYEKAFENLSLEDQAAISARLEDGLSYKEIATELGKPSPDAARMAVTRALVRLAKEMKRVAEP